MPIRLCPGPGPGRRCTNGQGGTAALVTARPGSKQATRCARCQAQHNRAHNARRPDLHDPAETRRRAQAVAQHVAAHGWWCPGRAGYHGPHASRDLTAHHVDAVGAGGSAHGWLEVICRSLNSQLGAGR